MCMSPKDGDTDLGVLLPKEINGWSVTEEDRLFDPETIFDYINGAGEVYRAFNFKSLFSIFDEVFKMLSFGFFFPIGFNFVEFYSYSTKGDIIF